MTKAVDIYRTYGQCKEIIRDICTPCAVNEKRKAYQELKQVLGEHFIGIRGFDGDIVYYELLPAGMLEDECWIGFNFATKEVHEMGLYKEEEE